MLLTFYGCDLRIGAIERQGKDYQEDQKGSHLQQEAAWFYNVNELFIMQTLHIYRRKQWQQMY